MTLATKATTGNGKAGDRAITRVAPICVMQFAFLARLQRSARYALLGALLLVIGVPLYQLAVLQPSGYGDALATPAQTLRWIAAHTVLFLGYRALLIVGFTLMLGLPFALFRIIIAQEILGRDELDEEDDEDPPDEKSGTSGDTTNDTPQEPAAKEPAEDSTTPASASANASDGLPDFAWRGRGFAVLAAWLGVAGLVIFPLATLASTLYLAISSGSASSAPNAAAPAVSLTGLFAVLTFTVGGGLLGVSCLFFGAVITRSGRRLWPDSWLVFGYVALALAALLTASAVEVALAPGASQAALSTPAILLFGLWVGWFGIMVVRLRPE